MAAELVGTAYVRIRAITAGLASDIKDGVDKGVKDADIDKAGESLGGDLGESTSEGFGKSLADGGIADGVTDAFDTPEVHKASEEGGHGVAKDVTKGIDDENKRRNPFASMLDALKRLSFKDVLKGKTAEIDRDLGDSFRNLDLPDLALDFDIPGLERDAEDAGEKVGDKVTDGITKSHKRRNPFSALGDALGKIELPKPINWLGIFGPTTLAPIIGGILSALALVVQSLGFIVTAAAGAGAALAGVAAVAAPGIGVLIAAFKVQTKQLEKFQKAAKKLLKPWEQVGVATQEFLLPGIENLLEAIQHLIPFFVEFGSRIGRIMGDMATFAGAILTSEKNMDALGRILEASEQFFVNIRTAALNLVDLLLPFLEQVAPLAVQFSESIANWATHLHETLNQEGAMQALGDRIQTWYDRFVLLVGIIGDVFVGLWGILEIAGTTGTPFFDKIAEAAQKFRDWVGSVEGQNKIKKFFEDAQPVLDEIWRLLGNVYNLIVAPAVEGDGGSLMFSRLATALDLLNDVLENPITATVVPYLLSLVVGLSLLSTLAGPMKAIGGGLQILGGAIQFIGGLGLGAANVILSVAGAIIKLSFALIASPLGLILLSIAAAVTAVYFAFKYWDQIVEWLKVAWEWFTKLSTPMQILVGTIGALILLTNPIAQFAAAVLLVVAAIKNWREILAVVDEVWDTLWEFFTGLPDLVSDAFDALVEFATNLPEKLAPLGESILEFFQSIPGKIKDAMIAGLEALPQAILDALGGMFELGQNLLGLIADGLAYALPRIAEFFVGLPGTILRLIGRVLPKLLEIGLQIIGFILKGLASALPRIFFFFLRLPVELATLLRKGLWEFLQFAWDLVAALLRGLVDAGPSLLKWFQDLPGNLLSMLTTAVTWLYNVGKDILIGIYNGVVNNVGAVFDWFTALPGVILGLIGDALVILWDAGGNLITGLIEGAKAFLGSLDEFFGGLPQMIVDFVGAAAQKLIDLGGSFIGWLVEGVTGLAQNLWDWFTGLPQTVLDLVVAASQTIIDIGKKIPGWIVDGIVAAAQTLWDWVSGLPQAIWDTLNGISQEILDLGGDIIGWIIDGLVESVQDIWDWFTDLPDDLWGVMLKAKDAWLDIGGDIAGWIVDGFGGIGQALWNALKTAWNWVADKFKITIPIPFAEDITISAPHLTMGGIFPGSQAGTPIIVAEGGRGEAVIPMTRPARALELMQQSGLDKLVLDAYLGGSAGSSVTSTAGDTTMLHIDTAVMTTPVDVDMVAQKITAAYNRMAS